MGKRFLKRGRTRIKKTLARGRTRIGKPGAAHQFPNAGRSSDKEDCYPRWHFFLPNEIMDFASCLMWAFTLLTIIYITDQLLEQRRRETKTGEFRDDED